MEGYVQQENKNQAFSTSSSSSLLIDVKTDVFINQKRAQKHPNHEQDDKFVGIVPENRSDDNNQTNFIINYNNVDDENGIRKMDNMPFVENNFTVYPNSKQNVHHENNKPAQDNEDGNSIQSLQFFDCEQLNLPLESFEHAFYAIQQQRGGAAEGVGGGGGQQKFNQNKQKNSSKNHQLNQTNKNACDHNNGDDNSDDDDDGGRHSNFTENSKLLSHADSNDGGMVRNKRVSKKMGGKMFDKNSTTKITVPPSTIITGITIRHRNYGSLCFVFFVLFYCGYLIIGSVVFQIVEVPIEHKFREHFDNVINDFRVKYPSVTGKCFYERI